MKISEATVGTKVKSNMAFAGVPKYTEGIIDEDYGSGVMVAWDLIDRPLPSNYKKYNGLPAIAPGQPLRDGFDKESELEFLDKIEDEDD